MEKKVIRIEGNYIAIDAKIVDAYKRYGLGPIELFAELYLHTDLESIPVKDIFEKYPIEVITETIVSAAKQELSLCGITIKEGNIMKKITVFEKEFFVPDNIATFYESRVCSPLSDMAEVYLHADLGKEAKEKVKAFSDEELFEYIKPWILAECDALGIDYGQI